MILFACGLMATGCFMHIVEYFLYIVSFFSNIIVSLNGHLGAEGYNYGFLKFIFNQKTN
jgi:hypothetical protein